MPQPSSSGAVMRNGLIFGGILGALYIGNTLVQWLTGAYAPTSQVNGGITSVNFASTGISAVFTCGVFLALLGLTFVAGMLATRRTGSVGDGSLAGLVAGAMGALVGGVTNIVVILTLVAPGYQPPADSVLSQSQMQQFLVGGAILGVVGGLALDAGLGAGLGALGGLVGKSSYQKANTPMYQPPFYPVAPMQPGAYYPYAPYPGPQYPAPPYAGPPPYAPPPPYAGPQYPTQPYPGQPSYPMPPTQPQESPTQPQEPPPTGE